MKLKKYIYYYKNNETNVKLLVIGSLFIERKVLYCTDRKEFVLEKKRIDKITKLPNNHGVYPDCLLCKIL